MNRDDLQLLLTSADEADLTRHERAYADRVQARLDRDGFNAVTAEEIAAIRGMLGEMA